MPLKEQDHNLIEKQIMSQLNDEDRKIFEERLNDPDFKNELNFRSDLTIAFKAEGRENLKNQLKGFEKKLAKAPSLKKKDAVRFSISRVMLIAASLALLFIAGNWFLNQSASNDQLYAQFFNDYPNVVAPINKSTSDTDRRGEAFQAYELKNYQDALNRFDQLNSQDEDILLYQGLCEMALDHPQKAFEYFDLMKNSSSPYYVPMNWYKALALLKTGKIKESKMFLNIVIQDAKTKALKSQAIELLGVLNQ